MSVQAKWPFWSAFCLTVHFQTLGLLTPLGSVQNKLDECFLELARCNVWQYLSIFRCLSYMDWRLVYISQNYLR